VRIEKLESEYDVRVEYVHFPLHPDTPPEGRTLVDLFGGRDALPRIQAAQRRLKSLTEAEGLPFGERERTYNSRLAQELGAWAESRGKGAAFHRAVFRAYFGAAKDISDAGLLADLAASVGLDRSEAAAVLRERRSRDAVDRDWERCRRAGIDAVPTFEVGGGLAVGAQPYETLVQLVVQAGARRR